MKNSSLLLIIGFSFIMSCLLMWTSMLLATLRPDK